MLKIENLYIQLGDTSIKIPEMVVKDGEYVAIMGTTGAGKTVLAETLVGFYSPKKGVVMLNGKNIMNLPVNRRGIAIVYQDYMLFPHMTVRQNIEYPIKSRGRGDMEKIVKLLEIGNLLDRYPQTLSGGEMQRVALARALLTEPQVIIMDEPFSSLDRRTKEKVRRIVKNTLRELNATVIHITHDIETAMVMAEKLCLMHEGEMIQCGTLTEVLQNPTNRFVAEFMNMNVLHGKVIGRDKTLTVVDVNNTKIYSSSPGHGDVLVAIRPESIILSKTKLESSMRNMLRGRIENMERRGSVVYIHLNFGTFTMLSVLTPNAIEALSLKIGNEVYVYFKASAVKIIR